MLRSTQNYKASHISWTPDWNSSRSHKRAELSFPLRRTCEKFDSRGPDQRRNPQVCRNSRKKTLGFSVFRRTGIDCVLPSVCGLEMSEPETLKDDIWRFVRLLLIDCGYLLLVEALLSPITLFAENENLNLYHYLFHWSVKLEPATYINLQDYHFWVCGHLNIVCKEKKRINTWLMRIRIFDPQGSLKW